MFTPNSNFLNLPKNYLFSEIARRVKEYRDSNPDAPVISMGIGDVTRPICEAACCAMHRAVDDLAQSISFHGYGPEQGYPFLREKIAQFDYNDRGIHIDADEIFISDGAKSDTGNIVDLFGPGLKIAVTDPAYPVYVDTNVIRSGCGTRDESGHYADLTYLPCTAGNNFVPTLPQEQVDVIYLCYPNNPTGTVLSRPQLKEWVDYALSHNSLLLFDSAYEAYIHNVETTPRSIYEIEGARKCAIEFRSFSKTAGFTGVRCGYTVVPRDLTVDAPNGEKMSLREMWLRRQCTKFNGASYVAQRGAEALYSAEGRCQVMATIEYYMDNARLLLNALAGAGLRAVGGVDSPYLWVATPAGMTSWEFFDMLLHKLNLVVTPGSGFGPAGEGFVRLTAFNTHEATLEACRRLISIPTLLPS